MRRTTVMFLAILAAIAALIILMGIDLTSAGAAEPSPSPSPSPSATFTPPPPASPQLIAWALGWKHRADSARSALCRVRDCYGAHHPIRLFPTPKRAAGRAEWTRAGRRWRHQARDWREKVRNGIAKMRHPGGCGAARWWPAARYCGWPSRLKSWFCYVVWRESSARLQAENPSSHCYGLLQEHPCWWGAKGYGWIRDAFHQLRLGWHIYRVQGPSAWAL